MEVGRPSPILRARRNVQPPTKQASPVAVKKSVSVAAIFKSQPQKVTKPYLTPQPARSTPKLSVEDAPAEKEQGFKSGSSPRNPRKSGQKVSRKRADMHPLAVAFKETSDDYRRQLYTSTTFQINKTLQDLLQNLYESTLQPISSSANDDQVSPIRLTVSAKLEREAQKLYLPISAYSVRLTRTSTSGEREQFMSPLGTRMADYAEHIEQQKKEIEKLRKEWEIIVGEIWKFGVGVLGEETMEELLFTNNGNELMSSLSKDTETESTLFVAEQGTSPPVRKTRVKKKVTFEAPEEEAESPRRHGEHLAFLYGPSLLRVKPAPDVPTLSEQDVDSLEEQVKQLGKKELEEYRKAEKEYEQYWRKKMAQVTNALRD